jgi:tRNA-2-methylthio-N6-dimethylallyladenosine synthase
MNKLDSALISTALERAGFGLTKNVDEADVVLLNTCSVRQHAEDRVLSHLGHLKHIKQTRPELVVGVIGCMAQRLGEELLQHQAVNLVCGPAQIPNIVNLLNEAIEKNRKNLAVTENIRISKQNNDTSLEQFESVYSSDDKQIPGQAFVRVMRGCDKFCTYCIVPYVRGPEHCRPPEAIIDQIKKLVGEGIKQVTLLGQTVNSYKYNAGDKTYFLSDLLYMASDVAGIEWVKFVTSYPMEDHFEELLGVMAETPKVCKYLHIPAQSGSDKILRAMNRHYTAKQYLDLLTRARAVVPDISIAGDFIVGFPGENEDDFQATVELLKKAQYKNAFIFKYSPRPGTGADKRLEDTVPSEVKQKRNIELLAVQNEISGQLNKVFLDRQVRVLVEGPSKRPHLDTADSPARSAETRADHRQLVGRTATDHIVVFNGPQSLAGEFANVIITKTSSLTLFGRLAT